MESQLYNVIPPPQNLSLAQYNGLPRKCCDISMFGELCFDDCDWQEGGSNNRLAQQVVAFKVQIGTYSLQEDERPQIPSDWTDLVLPKVSVMSDLPSRPGSHF